MLWVQVGRVESTCIVRCRESRHDRSRSDGRARIDDRQTRRWIPRMIWERGLSPAERDAWERRLPCPGHLVRSNKDDGLNCRST